MKPKEISGRELRRRTPEENLGAGEAVIIKKSSGKVFELERAVNSKLFLRKAVDISDSIAMARLLGDAHGWNKRYTTFDLWHLAAAWSPFAGAFLTFDERQGAFAKLLGMAS